MPLKLNPLSDKEKRVIIDKKTDLPFLGEYDNFYREGVYQCRQCNNIIFNSSSKFDAHCGWPSFDDAIPGTIKKIPDSDGSRTEVVCSRCNGHLGHLFTNEHFTPTNNRYCINSTSIKFIPKDEQ